MGYIEDSLVPGENVIYRAKISLGALVMPILSFILLVFLVGKLKSPFLTFVVILFGLFVAIRLLLIYTSTEFAITNHRIIAKKGFIRRHSIEILLSEIESVTVNQTLDGRIFGFGTVTVVGSGGTQEDFRAISNPLELRKRVNTQTITKAQNKGN